jgi:hypothetical protein
MKDYEEGKNSEVGIKIDSISESKDSSNSKELNESKELSKKEKISEEFYEKKNVATKKDF